MMVCGGDVCVFGVFMCWLCVCGVEVLCKM